MWKWGVGARALCPVERREQTPIVKMRLPHSSSHGLQSNGIHAEAPVVGVSVRGAPGEELTVAVGSGSTRVRVCIGQNWNGGSTFR